VQQLARVLVDMLHEHIDLKVGERHGLWFGLTWAGPVVKESTVMGLIDLMAVISPAHLAPTPGERLLLHLEWVHMVLAEALTLVRLWPMDANPRVTVAWAELKSFIYIFIVDTVDLFVDDALRPDSWFSLLYREDIVDLINRKNSYLRECREMITPLVAYRLWREDSHYITTPVLYNANGGKWIMVHDANRLGSARLYNSVITSLEFQASVSD